MTGQAAVQVVVRQSDQKQEVATAVATWVHKDDCACCRTGEIRRAEGARRAEQTAEEGSWGRSPTPPPGVGPQS